MIPKLSIRSKMLIASTLGTALGFPVVGSTLFGLFVVSLSEEFGWGRGDISIAYTLMGWTVAAASPVLGMVIDRFGPRRVLLVSIALFSAAIGSLSQLTDRLWHLYLMYGLVALTGVGTTPVSYSRAIVQWFDERRGLALGIGLSGIGMGSMLAPVFVDWLMQHYGWRTAYLGLALLVACISWPLCWLWMHDAPHAKHGNGEANAVSGSNNEPGTGSDALPGYSLSEALRSRAFFLILTGIVLLGLFTGTVSVHLVPLLQDRGADSTSAALAVSTLGLAAIAGRLLAGVLIDRFHAPLVAGFVLSAPAIGILLLMLGVTGPAVFVSALLIGIGFGAEMDLLGYVVSRYLGLRAYGRTYGVLYSAMIVGLGMGPLLMGYGQQLTGSYDAGLIGLTVVTFGAVVPFTLLGPYPRFAGAAPLKQPARQTYQYSR